jgi:hypothetical protein
MTFEKHSSGWTLGSLSKMSDERLAALHNSGDIHVTTVFECIFFYHFRA